MNYPARRAYLIFFVVSCAFLFSSINGTIVAVALPTMLNDLDTSLAWVGWTLTGFQLAQSIVMPLSGKLSDDWGARKVLLGSIALYTVASVLAGMAPNVYVLIAARIGQALGGGAMLPSATSLVSDVFGDKRATFIGLFTSIFPLGGVLGPNIGGFVIDNFSWRWLFYANGPIGLLVFLAGLALFPEIARQNEKKQIDAIGAGLFTGSLVAILSAMTAWGNDVTAFQDPLTWLGVVVGVVMLVVFLWHEGRTPAPIIELELLKWRPFAAANLYNFLYGASVFGFFSFIPYYAVVAFGMTAGESGMVLTPRSATMAIMSTVSSFTLIRWGYRIPLIAGVVFIAISLFLLSLGIHDVSLFGMQVPNVALMGSLVLFSGLGMGICGPASNNAALDLLPGKVAAVAGLRGMFRSAGGVLGTAGIILALSLFEDKAAGMQIIFLVLGLLILLAIPACFMIPDVARERYKAAQEEQRQKAEAAAVVAK